MPVHGFARGSTRAVATLALALGIAACRDVGEPFRPIDRGFGADVSRVTFSASDDRAPAWSADGDSIYYTTSSWEENPLAPATIVAIAADAAGPARVLLPQVQSGTQARSWLTAVAPAPEGERVAFIRVGQLLPEAPCGVGSCPADQNRPMVRLVEGELHVRARDAVGSLSEDSILPLAFSGHSVVVDETVPGDLLTVSDYHPFQLQFEGEARSFFRPAWSPDGLRLAVSDGLRVHVWDLASGVVEQLPFSQDAFMPAWSPDGEWIAFARYERIASQVITCEYTFNFVHACTERRIIHHHAPPRIVLVRADRTGFRELDLRGTDPAWSPDGRYLYFATDFPGYPVIARMDMETEEVDIIEGTEAGIEPSISPDGRRVAFARPGDSAHDIWVAELR